MERQCQSDGELLRSYVRTGRDEPFRALMERHGAMVMAVCRRISGRPADAEDLFQVVFMTLMDKAGSLQERECLAGWLHRTAWHLAQRARRDAGTRDYHEHEVARLQTEDVAAAPAGDEIYALHQALNVLPDPYRDAVILHHLEGLSIEQTAKALGRPTGTVAAQVSRARRLIRDRLQSLYGPAFALAALGLLAPSDEDFPTALAGEPVAVFTPRTPPPLANVASFAVTGFAAAPASGITVGTAGLLKAAAVLGALMISGVAIGGTDSLAKVVDALCGSSEKGGSAPVGGVDTSPKRDSSPISDENWGGSALPEPGTAGLLVIGALGLLLRRR